MRRQVVSTSAEPSVAASHPRAVELSAFLDDEYRRVVGSVALITGDRASAEDAVNDAVVTAWSRREQSIERLAAWITVVASNNARSVQRRRGAEQRAIDRAEREAVPSADEPDIGDDALKQALAALPRREREVAVLHYVLDQSVNDTAADLEIAPGTVKTLLSRARAHLAEALDDGGVS